MCPFRLVDHPADLGIHAQGATCEEAFAEAARGLLSVIVEASGIAEKEGRDVRLEAADREQLLVRWLSEVLYLYDGEGFLGARFFVDRLSDTGLSARIAGERFDSARHTAKLDVKAVTYHNLRVAHTDGGWEVEVVVDI